jgi:hypothetical protein
LESGPNLLADQPSAVKIFEAVIAERRRLGMDDIPPVVAEEETVAEGDVAENQELVSSYTKGKKLLILGGVPRQRTCDELKEALGCASVQWLDSKKSDRAAKFQTEVKKVDFLLVAKNFAGHDMGEKGRQWIKEVGGDFLFLPSGYGVNQIIFQLYRYISNKGEIS